MSQRITLYVRVRLLSDTIFGAGFSVPGGEDIAVPDNRHGETMRPRSYEIDDQGA